MIQSSFQLEVARFVEQHRLAVRPDVRLLDLASEVGELGKEWLESTEYGSASFRPGPNWANELSDAFFTLVTLANATDVDLEKALAAVMTKYRNRLATRGDPGSGS